VNCDLGPTKAESVRKNKAKSRPVAGRDWRVTDGGWRENSDSKQWPENAKGNRKAGHAALDLRIVQVLRKCRVIRAGERVTVHSDAGFNANCPISMSPGQAGVTRRRGQTTQGTLRPLAFAGNRNLGVPFRLSDLLTRPSSVTAGVVAIKVWNSHFFLLFPTKRTYSSQ